MSKIHRVKALPAAVVAGDCYLEKRSSGITMHVATAAGDRALRLRRKVHLQGPTSLFFTEVGTYAIKDYSDKFEYTVSSTDGVVTRVGNVVTFVVNDPLVTTGHFTINARVFAVTIKPIVVITPTIMAPVAGATDVAITGTVVYASAFALNYAGTTDTLQSADWELSTDPNFTTLVASSYNDTTNKTSWPIPT